MNRSRKIVKPTRREDRAIRRGMRADPDTYEATAAEFAQMRPLRGRPKGSGRKVRLTVRLDRDVVDHFRATGQGWQTRLNDALVRVVSRART
ncbi:MAG: BrnA antitoxin family protein [Gammaproteobacteria bacterium]|nr:MAG: BrnA antitoxin family protein [Gammaproteobacteria bacterium]